MSGGGAGTAIKVFMSWSWFPFCKSDSGPIGGLMVYLIYLIILLIYNALLAERHDWKYPFPILVIYFIGICLALLDKNFPYGTSLVKNIIGILLSVPLVLAYLTMDWRLAGGSAKPVPTGKK